METVIAQNEAKTETFYEFLSQEYLPQMKDQLGRSSVYLEQEVKDFLQMEHDCEDLVMQLENKKIAWNANVKNLSEKNQKETDLQKRVEEYKKAKKKELVEKQKTIDSLTAAMKESCSKIRPDLIAKVQLNEVLTNVFEGIFQIIYDKPKNEFEWNDFKKQGLLFDKGQDFQSRLANFPLKNCPKEKLEILQQLQTDKAFESLLEDKLYTNALIDLAEWITFAVNGIKFTNERTELQVEFDKINKDFENRGKDLQNTGKSQEFWETSFNYVDDQIGFLSTLNAALKGISNDVRSTHQNLEQHISEYVQATKDIGKSMQVPNF